MSEVPLLAHPSDHLPSGPAVSTLTLRSQARFVCSILTLPSRPGMRRLSSLAQPSARLPANPLFSSSHPLSHSISTLSLCSRPGMHGLSSLAHQSDHFSSDPLFSDPHSQRPGLFISTYIYMYVPTYVYVSICICVYQYIYIYIYKYI